jgi:YVTN family beta-propeller protein
MLVSITGAAQFAYIPNFQDNNVSMIDTATNTVVATTVNVGSILGEVQSAQWTKCYVAIYYGNILYL